MKNLFSWTLCCLSVGAFVLSVSAMKNEKKENNKEIEIKFQLDKENRPIFDQFNGKHTSYQGQVLQQDAYFDKDTTLREKEEKLRIREETPEEEGKTKSIFICFKHRYINEQTGMCERVDELDVNVTDPSKDVKAREKFFKIFDLLGVAKGTVEQLAKQLQDEKIDKKKLLIKIFENWGYKQFKVVEKTRTSFFYQGLEIAYDDVTNLGKFIEIELKYKCDTVEKGKQDIYKFLKDTVKLKEINEFNNDYLSMLLDSKKMVFETLDLNKIVKE